MNFVDAIKAVESGKDVRRIGWEHTGVLQAERPEMAEADVPFRLVVADGNLRVPYLASRSIEVLEEDMFAEDWEEA